MHTHVLYSQNRKFRATLTVWNHNLWVTKSAGAKVWVDEWIAHRVLLGWTVAGWRNVDAKMRLDVTFRCRDKSGDRAEARTSRSDITKVIDIRTEAYGLVALGPPGGLIPSPVTPTVAPEMLGPFWEVHSVGALAAADLAGELVKLGPLETAPG
jgi:hypothetical protein